MYHLKCFIILAGFSLVVSSSFAQTKIMTYNIRYDNPNDGDNWWDLRKSEVVELLKYYNADFIGLQEAMPNQTTFIAKQLDTHKYIGHGRDGIDTNSEGIPIFYNSAKYELLSTNLFWLSDTPEKISKGWDAALNRIALHGVFKDKATNQTIHILNTHFDHMGKIARLKSAELLVAYIRKNNLTKQKIILMGDFNSHPSDAPIKIIEQEMEDSYTIKNRPVYGPIGTFNGFKTTETVSRRIDYIFTQNTEIKSYRCIDDRRKNNLHVSDHFAVIIEI